MMFLFSQTKNNETPTRHKVTVSVRLLVHTCVIPKKRWYLSSFPGGLRFRQEIKTIILMIR